MRADIYLMRFHYAESRQKAQILIKNGAVSIDGRLISKASEDIDELSEHKVDVELSEADRYVSRGAIKLVGALDGFDISPNGCVCIDIGASTGGFTDCLLKKGAARVYAFDSGRDQLHPKLLSDSRVVSKEGFNARYLSFDDVGEMCDIAVMDVSFISQTMIIPRIPAILKSEGVFVGLIKPQFEAGRDALGKNGIVKDSGSRLKAAVRVVECAASFGLQCRGFMRSPIKGGDGNEEYLACFVNSGKELPENERIALYKQIKETV